MKEYSREEIEAAMDLTGYGNASIEEVAQIVKESALEDVAYSATVVTMYPHEFFVFDAKTIDELTAKIIKAVNSREYVARYRAFGFATSNQASASRVDEVRQS